ncbi:MAG: MFS transporter [Streptosporangiales bacterium]|nr:MFS transporter [Streptosporangiales bacterium]
MRGFVAFGLLGRMAIAMLSLGIVLMIAGLTGSYGTAGLIAGVSVLAGAAGAPLLGRLADRYGQGRVVTLAVPVHCVGLVGLAGSAVLGAPTWVLGVWAVVTGGCYPPVGPFVRARWAHRLSGSPKLNSAYALESVFDELLFVTGPVLVTLLATRVHATAGLAAALVVTVVGGIGFVRQRATDPPPQVRDGRSGFALRQPVVFLVTLVTLTAGVSLGALDVAVVAFTDASGVPWAAGLVLALFAAGSAAGGLTYGALPLRVDPLARVVATGTLLGVAFLPLAFLSSIGLVAAFAFVSGVAIAPLIVSCTTLVERVQKDTLTESLTWVTTGILVGVAVGSWLAGRVADLTAGSGGFLVVTPAAVLAAAVTWLTALVLRRR